MRKDALKTSSTEDDVLKSILGGDSPAALFGTMLIQRLNSLGKGIDDLNQKFDAGNSDHGRRLDALEAWRKEEVEKREERKKFLDRNETRLLTIASILAVLIAGLISALPHVALHFGK